MPKIVAVTWARNAEKTLRRAAESIMRQSYPEWTYYLIDNDSSDDTLSLMRELAAEDSRITVTENGENDMQIIAKFLPKLLEEYGPDDFFTVLDADDSYAPEFFSETLKFSVDNSLDLVCCGSNIIYTDKPNELRIAPEDIILTGEAYSKKFPEYYIFIRTFWAKLYSFRLLNICDLFFPPGLVYGLDTCFAFEAFAKSDRAGILSKALHDYYVYPQSVSSKVTPMRIESDRLLYERGERYLLQKSPEISRRNRNFLNEAYFQAVRETQKILFRQKAVFQIPKIYIKPRFLRIFLSKLFNKIFQKEDS